MEGSVPASFWIVGLTALVLIAWSAYEWWKYHHMRRGGEPHTDVMSQKTTAAIVTAVAIPVSMFAAFAIATSGF